MTESLENTKKKLDKTLKEAQRLHNTGDLSGALKAYRKAQKWIRDKKVYDEVTTQINELHDMVAFVQESDDQSEEKLSDKVTDWVKANTLLLFGVSITLTALVLLAVLVPMVLRSARTVSAQPSPSPTVEIAEDRYERGDNYQVQAELKGNGSGGGGGKPKKKKPSVVTLTIPEVLYDPFPSKYVITQNAPVYLEIPSEEKIEPDQKVARNSLVVLTDKTPDDSWLHIEGAGEGKYWISAAHLSDFKYKTPEEIDAEIKAEMGGKYWELEVKGSNAPFQYFLKVNAPTAREAHESTVKAYTTYANRQMLKSLNALSHQKTDSIRLEPSGAPAEASQTVNVAIQVYATKGGIESQLGTKTFTLSKDDQKRYTTYQILEGF